MSEKLYKATFRGVRKTAKSPSYNKKDACYRWLASNAHRIQGELLVYEIDINRLEPVQIQLQLQMNIQTFVLIKNNISQRILFIVQKNTHFLLEDIPCLES